jgi:tRNA-2-methylthio-N6-dimethylallyladenosine synthase
MGNIGALKPLKKKKPNLIVGICGCMSQAEGRGELITKKFPFVDSIFGTHNIHTLKELIEKRNSSKKRVLDVWEKEKGIFEDIEVSRDNVNSNAWVNINFGCNNFCSYCIVPYVRGRERSRKPEDIKLEVETLVKEGYRYITLLGQNVNSYGNDFEDKNINFANLLKLLCEIEGDFKIKFMTSHPKDLSEEVIKTIANNEKLCKVIHLPIQSGSNAILKSMNRKYTREHYLSLIQMIRKHIPEAYISTDIIVGFPGETEEDFMDTYNLINEVKYDGVFAFMYSRRSGTVADKMENQIDENIKNDRVNKLLKLSKSITREKNKELIGKSLSVMAVNKIDEGFEAFTDSGKSIIVKEDLEKFKFYNIKITKCENGKLYGEII